LTTARQSRETLADMVRASTRRTAIGGRPKTPLGTPLPATLLEVFQRLLASYGPQRWWPADTPFEVMIGAILTQSAAWSNVEKAIFNLKAQGLLHPEALRTVPLSELAAAVRPSGYFNSKAKKLKALAGWLEKRHDDISAFRKQDARSLRDELLSVYGVGEETADSIMLYACDHPVFVVDAYTKRILGRLGIKSEKDSYANWQALFMENLPRQASLFNEYHALLVRHGKSVCRKMTPDCLMCCLVAICPFAGRVPHRVVDIQ